MSQINRHLVQKLLYLYLDRCKFKHTLAFFQFRRLKLKVEDQDVLSDLIEIFQDRRDYLSKILAKLNSKVKRDVTKRGKHITTDSKGIWHIKDDSECESSDDPEPITDIQREYVMEGESPMMKASLEKKLKK